MPRPSSDNDEYRETILNVPFIQEEIKRVSPRPSENDVMRGALFSRLASNEGMTEFETAL